MSYYFSVNNNYTVFKPAQLIYKVEMLWEIRYIYAIFANKVFVYVVLSSIVN